ncbi:MAG: LysR family transcriptional regulator [Mogibacterium sp.]|nr:LysR family transcriptional regulator [Mogibacterium sp.]
MTFRHLECAIAVANAGSINNAAKKLLVSQPYLSNMINSLERELGYSIFIRSSHGISCTAEGAAFMERAERIMSDLVEIRSLGSESEVPLSVATYYSRFITEGFRNFHNMSGNAPSDRYREMGNMEVIDALTSREFSLGIIYHAKTKLSKFATLATAHNLTYNALFDDMGTYLIMSDDHPLAHKEEITIDDLNSSAVVFFDDVSTMLYFMDHLKLQESSSHFAVSDRGAYMDALLSGHYLSIINTPYPEKENLFVLRDLSGCLAEGADFEVSSAYLTHQGHSLTRREQDFLSLLLGR